MHCFLMEPFGEIVEKGIGLRRESEITVAAVLDV
jgi:hypothetical protein